MSRIRTTTIRAAQEVEQESRKIATNPNFAWLARLGFAARSSVYLIIGALAMAAAVGRRGPTPGVRGALLDLVHAPFGQILALAIGVGMLAFAIWRSVQALADTDNRDFRFGGVMIRLGELISAVIYVSLAVYATAIAFGWHSAATRATISGNAGARSWSARALSVPGGQEALAVVGGIVVGVGVGQIVLGWQGYYRRHLALSERKEKWLNPICKFGLIARGMVFVIIGIFICVAALQARPAAARGFGGALQSLLAQPFGRVLLFIVALGLLAFAVYSLIEAIYHRFASATGAEPQDAARHPSDPPEEDRPQGLRP
jgi:hypothetical protein